MTLSLSSIKLFSFDFDGTLVLSNHIKRKSFFDVVSENYPKHSHEICVTLFDVLKNNPYMDRYGIFKQLEKYHSYIDSDKLSKDYGKKCHELIINADEVAGSSALLNKIKSLNKHVIINSATPKESLISIVKQLELQKYIDGIYGAPISKTQNLQDAMKKYDLSPREVLVIGDGDNDRVAAENIGCLFAGIENEYSNHKIIPKILGSDLQYIISALQEAS